MNKKIIDKRPGLFEKTEANIWTDPYIQLQMVREHLNPHSDGASRKQESIGKVVEFIRNHIPAATSVLDLGCGPGLYTSILKDSGYEVTGIDFNRAAIAYAARQREDITYIAGDYLQSYPSGEYGAVIMIYCDMGTHSDSDRDRLLKNIYSSLKTGGVLIFDVFTSGLVQDK